MGWPVCEPQPLSGDLAMKAFPGSLHKTQSQLEYLKEGSLKRKYCVATPVQEDEC